MIKVTVKIPRAVVTDLNLLRKLPTQVAQKAYVFDEFLKIAKRYKSRCYICEQIMSYNTQRLGWTFHHKYYDSRELSYRCFDKTKDEFMWKANDWCPNIPTVLKKAKGIEMRALYRLEVFRQVRKRKGQFLLMCSTHHQALEKIDRFSPDKVKRLISAWKMTKTKWKVK